MRYGGRSKRGYVRYNGRPFGETPVVRIPLGDYDERSGLAELRCQRAACEDLIRQNKSPKVHSKLMLEQRLEQQQLTKRTLGEALEDFFEFGRTTLWRSPHTIALNESIKKNHLDRSKLMAKPLDQITPADMRDLISPFWWGRYKPVVARKPPSHGTGLGIRMRSLLHSTFELEFNAGRFSGRNPCDWSEKSKLSQLLGPKPVSVRHAAPDLDDLPHIIAHILDPNRSRIPGHLTTAELTDCTGVSDIALRKYRDADLLHRSSRSAGCGAPRPVCIPSKKRAGFCRIGGSTSRDRVNAKNQ